VVLDFLLKVFNENLNKIAVHCRGESCTYEQLLTLINEYDKIIGENHIDEGSVVAIVGDFSPKSIALLLALINKRCTIVPLTEVSLRNKSELFQIAQVEYSFNMIDDDLDYEELEKNNKPHKLIESIRKINQPGLILFTSGSSGEPKAAVHNFQLLLEKFKQRKRALRTINFLLFDHWGGLNTMFYILSNGGEVIAAKDRSPTHICALVQEHKIQLLPTSPTFLKLMLISGVHQSYDMGSLEVISYGTEPMPESTLERLNVEFPDVKLLQTYGLIELGVLQSKSKKNDSLWVKIGGDGYDTRVVDGMLEIKAQSAMFGYLNAPSPFTKDGWFKTGDSVEVDGDYIKILGRKSELINVGGEKVYPQEIENIILRLKNVVDVTVFGERNALLGNVVCADIILDKDEDEQEFIKRCKDYCRQKMKKHMIPVKITLSKTKLYSNRFKKSRV
jgi:long-chain acyl-CoA synthetase